MKLLYLRHSISVANEDDICTGHAESPPSAAGIELAAQVRASQKKLLDQYSYVLHSPIDRAKYTATVLFPNAKLQVVDDLQEWNVGDWAGLPNKNVPDLYDLAVDVAPPNGETTTMFKERIRKGLQDCLKLAQSQEKFAIVGHGAWFFYAVNVLGLPSPEAEIKNCEGVVFEFEKPEMPSSHNPWVIIDVIKAVGRG